jgi:hypothetical protein
VTEVTQGIDTENYQLKGLDLEQGQGTSHSLLFSHLSADQF